MNKQNNEQKIQEELATISAEENNEKEDISQYKGLGGWLILVIIGLFSMVAMEVYYFFESIALFKDDTIRAFIDYSGALGNLFKIEMVVGILFLIFAIYLILLFFQKSKKFPKYYIILLVASVIWPILEYIIWFSLPVDSNEFRQIINETLSEEVPEIGRGIITMFVWGLYMIKSKRVKATFIEK